MKCSCKKCTKSEEFFKKHKGNIILMPYDKDPLYTKRLYIRENSSSEYKDSGQVVTGDLMRIILDLHEYLAS